MCEQMFLRMGKMRRHKGTHISNRVDQLQQNPMAYYCHVIRYIPLTSYLQTTPSGTFHLSTAQYDNTYSLSEVTKIHKKIHTGDETDSHIAFPFLSVV